MVEAQMAYNKRDAKSIKELCQKAIGYNPDNDAAYYMLARVALIESNFSEAEKLLKRVVDTAKMYYKNPEHMEESVKKILDED